MMSSEMDEMYCRMKNIPKALAAPGMIRGNMVSIHFKSRMIRKIGTKVTAPGITMVASKNENNPFWPGNLNLAKAYPPSEQKNRLNTVPDAAIKKVFQVTRT